MPRNKAQDVINLLKQASLPEGIKDIERVVEKVRKMFPRSELIYNGLWPELYGGRGGLTFTVKTGTGQVVRLKGRTVAGDTATFVMDQSKFSLKALVAAIKRKIKEFEV